MRSSLFKEGLPFVAILAAGIAVFFIVRLILPTGDSALPPLPLSAEPPTPVFQVALPEPPPAPKPRAEEPEAAPAVATLVSQPIAVARKAPPRKPAVTKPKPEPAPQAPRPAPAPQPAPEPEPVRTLASVQRTAAPNPSPGRAKHGKSAPPGRAEKTKQKAPEPAVSAEVVPVADAAVTENPSPGREKHDKGLPPGQAKKGD